MEVDRKYSKQGLKVVLVNVDLIADGTDLEEAVPAATRIWKLHKITAPLFVHTGELDPLLKLLGTDIRLPPITAVFKNGKLLHTVEGAFLGKSDLERLLKSLKVVSSYS